MYSRCGVCVCVCVCVCEYVCQCVYLEEGEEGEAAGLNVTY